jgi:flagellar motor component MotA
LFITLIFGDFMKLFFALVLIIFITLFTYILSGGNLIVLIQINASMCIIPSAFLLGWGVCPRGSFSRTFSIIFRNKIFDDNDKIKSINYLKAIGFSGLVSSVIFTILAIIVTMSNIDRGIEVLGHYFAADLVCLIYGLTILFISKAAQFNIESR